MKFNIFVLMCFLLTLSLFVVGESAASTYFVSAKGTGTTCSDSNPCAPYYAINTKSKEGDTIYFKDGIYKGANYMIDVETSGTSENIKKIKAINDGKVIIDGERSRRPCYVFNQSYITIEGVICQNSSSNSVYISGSDHVVIKRVTGRNGDFDDSIMTMGNGTTYSTFEDCAAYGTGRKGMLIISSNHNIIRRAWIMVEDYYRPDHQTGGVILQTYRGNYNLIENVVGTVSSDCHNNVVASQHDGTVCPGAVKGIGSVRAALYGTSIDNKFYGNVVIDPKDYYSFYFENSDDGKSVTGTEFHHNAAIRRSYPNRMGGAYFGTNDTKNGIMQNLTVTGFQSGSGFRFADGTINGTLINSSIVGNIQGLSVSSSGHTHSHNFYDNVIDVIGSSMNSTEICNTLKCDEKGIDPFYDTETFGIGAYLMIPASLKGKGQDGEDIGAEVLYQYDNSVKTDKPLWPWPMEKRICNETGYSVTYENGYSGCVKGGGLWKSPEALTSVYNSGNNESVDSSAAISDDTSIDSSSTNAYNYIIKSDPLGTYIDAENFNNSINTQENQSFILKSDSMEYAGSGYLSTAGPSTLTCDKANVGKEYKIHLEETGTYNVWIRGYGSDTSSDSVFIGINGTCVGALNPNGVYHEWIWTNNIQDGTGVNTIEITSPGVHSVNLWIREPNFLVDGIYLTQGIEAPPDDISLLDSIPPAPPAGLVIE